MLENAVAAPIDVEWQDLSQAWWSAPVGKHLERLVEIAEQVDSGDCRAWLDALDRTRDAYARAIAAEFVRGAAEIGYDLMLVDPWRARHEIAEHHVPEDVANLDRPQFERLRLEAWQASDVPRPPAIPDALAGAAGDPHLRLEAAGGHGYCASWCNGEETHFEVESPGDARQLLVATSEPLHLAWTGDCAWAVRDAAVLTEAEVTAWLGSRAR